MTNRQHRSRPARETRALPVIFRFSRSAEIYLKLIPHGALQNIRMGAGTEQDWYTLRDRLNIGQSLARHAFAERHDVHEVIDDAVLAVVTLGKRYRATGRMVLKGDELRAVGDALNLIDDMQSETTQRQQRTAARALDLSKSAT
ncbi:hypothetical protein ACI2VH_02625 [Ralstonia nicotianae]